MMKKIQDDFQEFLKSSEIPPQELSDRVFSAIRIDLNPSASKVFFKVLGIHSLVSLFTLSLCSQFGFRLFGEGPGLMGYLMRLGDLGCMAACGIVFLGTTGFASGLMLSPPEGKRLLKEWPAHAVLLLGISFGFFASVDGYFALQTITAWIMGAFVGAYTLLAGGVFLKRRLLHAF